MTTVEEVVDDQTPAVEEIVEDEEETRADAPVSAPGKGKMNRNEKKARKMMSKIGLKPVEGVKRVAIRKSRDMLFIIKDPEVLKSPTSNTYIIFGEAKVEDLNQRAAANAAKQFSQTTMNTATPAPEVVADTVPDKEEPKDTDDKAVADEDGVNPNDVELVMAQADVSREKAIETLKKNQGDIVNTIMELTIS